MLKLIKIFLASSSELKKDRDEFELFISRRNESYLKDNIYLVVTRWESFIDAMSKEGLQSEYNKAVVGCDIFVSLFHTKAGEFTEEEFSKAVKTFLEKGKPLIYTYFKSEGVSLKDLKKEDYDSLFDFKKKLENLKHYPTYYDSGHHLQLQFGEQLTKILPQWIEPIEDLGDTRKIVPDQAHEVEDEIEDSVIVDPGEDKDDGTTDFEFEDDVFALLIGIDKYENGVDVPGEGNVYLADHQVTNLNFCVNDVNTFKDFLLRHEVAKDHITDLTEPAGTTSANILKELNLFSKRIKLETEKSNKEQPLVFVLVSCHGITDDDDGYFIPYNGDRSNLIGTAISYKTIKGFLNNLKTSTSKVVVLVDACHSGGLAKVGDKGGFQHDQISSLADTDNYFIIASCKSDQKSREKNGNGIFTRELLKLLQNSYQEISEESISTTNLLKPLVENVKKESDFQQEPVGSMGVGIVLGRNKKRRKENENKAIEWQEKRQTFFNIIEPFLEKDSKDDPVAAELLLYANKGQFVDSGYEKFLGTFDKYANEYWSNRKQSEEALSSKSYVLLNQYRTIKQQKKSEAEQLSAPTPVSTIPTESTAMRDTVDKKVNSSKEIFSSRRELKEEIVVKKFNREQIERIINPIYNHKYIDEWNLIERSLRSGVTQTIFINKVRDRQWLATENYKDDNYIEDGFLQVMKLFNEEWPSGQVEVPKNSLSVRFNN